MLDRHPVVRLVAFVFGLAVGAVTIAGGAWYVVDERERSIEQTAALAAIRGEQEAIRRELALQTADLEEIRQRQGEIMHRFDKIEDGHDRIVNAVHDGDLAVAVALGRVLERTEGP